MVTAGIISVVIGGHFNGGDHFDGGDHFGGGTGVRTRGTKVVVLKAAHSREIWGHATLDFLKFKVSEMPLLAFSAGYFQ